MNKEDLRKLLEEKTSEFQLLVGTPSVHPERVDQVKRHKKRVIEASGMKAARNLRKEEWEDYLTKLETGKYRPTFQPSEDLWDFRFDETKPLE